MRVNRPPPARTASIAGNDHHAAAIVVIAVVAIVGAIVISVDRAFQHVVFAPVTLVAALLAIVPGLGILRGLPQRAELLAREVAIGAIAGRTLPGGNRRAGARAEDAIGAVGAIAERIQPALRLDAGVAPQIGLARIDDRLSGDLAFRLRRIQRTGGLGQTDKALAGIGDETAVRILGNVTAESLFRTFENGLLESRLLALCRFRLVGGGVAGALRRARGSGRSC